MRIYRDTVRHEIRDLNVTSSLRGDFDAAHVTGDQHTVLPTDSQKHTIFAYAATHSDGSVRTTASRSHATSSTPSTRCPPRASRSRTSPGSVSAIIRTRGPGKGSEVRTAAITVTGAGDTRREWVVAGLKDLVVLKSTGSGFAGFLRIRSRCSKPPTTGFSPGDLVARWRHRPPTPTGDRTYAEVREVMLEQFANLQSKALQQTLFEMGRAVLGVPRISRRSGCRHPTSTTSCTTWTGSASRTTASVPRRRPAVRTDARDRATRGRPRRRQRVGRIHRPRLSFPVTSGPAPPGTRRDGRRCARDRRPVSVSTRPIR